MMFIWQRRAINPDQELERLCNDLKNALGARLKSVIAFGSVARGEFDPKRSNLNVLVVSELSKEALEAMGPAVRRWTKKGLAMPVLVAPEDVDDFARDFPVEFLDMQDHHKVVCGTNVLSGLSVNKKHLESQIEHDLALVQLHLRQSLIHAQGNEKKIRQALIGSVSSTTTLLKSALYLGSEKTNGLDRMQAAEKALKTWGLDGTVLLEVRNLRRKSEEPLLNDLLERYLTLIEQVLTQLRKN